MDSPRENWDPINQSHPQRASKQLFSVLLLYVKAAKHHQRFRKFEKTSDKEQNKKKINLKGTESKKKKIEENLKTTTKINILREVKCHIHETVKQVLTV